MRAQLESREITVSFDCVRGGPRPGAGPGGAPPLVLEDDEAGEGGVHVAVQVGRATQQHQPHLQQRRGGVMPCVGHAKSHHRITASDAI